MQGSLLAALLVLSATVGPPPELAPAHEARITAIESGDASDALRAGADHAAVPCAPAPRRVAIAETFVGAAGDRALIPRRAPLLLRHTIPRRRIPRLRADAAGDG